MLRDGSADRRQQLIDLANREPDRARVIGNSVVTQREIADLLSGGMEELWPCFDLYRQFKLFGLPFAGGWAEQPAVFIDALETLLQEEQALGVPR